MRKIAVALGVILGCLAGAPVFAQGMSDMIRGAYVGGSIGQAKQTDACRGALISCDDTDRAWRILAGYRFNPYIGAEIGYHDLGKATFISGGTTFEFKANAWELVAIGAFPLVDRLSAYGKLGVYRGEMKGNSNTFGPAAAKDTNTDFTLGLGLQYDVLRNLGVRGEYQKYNDLGGSNLGKSDVDVWSVGVIWRF
jgi:OOP family OmpA-OmpF porin